MFTRVCGVSVCVCVCLGRPPQRLGCALSQPGGHSRSRVRVGDYAATAGAGHGLDLRCGQSRGGRGQKPQTASQLQQLLAPRGTHPILLAQQQEGRRTLSAGSGVPI